MVYLTEGAVEEADTKQQQQQPSTACLHTTPAPVPDYWTWIPLAHPTQAVSTRPSTLFSYRMSVTWFPNPFSYTRSINTPSVRSANSALCSATLCSATTWSWLHTTAHPDYSTYEHALEFAGACHCGMILCLTQAPKQNVVRGSPPSVSASTVQNNMTVKLARSTCLPGNPRH
jgi:hypothetical protein